MRQQLVGGPLDGASIAQHGEEFIYVAGSSARTRVYCDASPGRLLYRRDGGGYLFAGHMLARCPGCESYTEAERCPVCDHELARV